MLKEQCPKGVWGMEINYHILVQGTGSEWSALNGKLGEHDSLMTDCHGS